MYTPKFFEETDTTNLLEFMREYNFAVLVTSAENGIEATHLPFVIETRGDKIVLIAHMARANEQWHGFSEKDVLVIFSGPHAYVSPLHYKEKINVPTWNYVAVHAYGRVQILPVEENVPTIGKLIAVSDTAYLEGNWREIPEEYKTNLAKGVVAFEIEVTDLQGKKKLNQNKPGEDALRVIAAFENGSVNEREIASFMKDVHKK